MKTFKKVISALAFASLLAAPCVQAQIGHYGSHTPPKPSHGIHTDTETNYEADPAVQPITHASIYLFEVGTHGPNTAPYSLIDCTLSGNGTVYGPDANGNCFVYSANDGSYNITNDNTNYYNQCDSDSSLIYLVAVGGQRVYDPSDPLSPYDPALANSEITNIAVSPVDCGDSLSLDYFNVSDLTTVAAAYTLATFANQTTTPVDAFSSKNTTASMGALLTAFQAANNLVPTTTNTDGASFGSSVNSTAQQIMNTVADVMVSCAVTAGSTSSGTPCGSLYGYATAPNLLTSGTLTPTDLWLTPLYMVENPTNNIANEWGLIVSTSNPVWSPTYTSSSSLPSTWDIENSSTTSLGGPVISNLDPPGAGVLGYENQREGTTLYINGTNLVGSCSGSPTAVINGIAASITFSSNTLVEATVPSTYSLNSSKKFPGYVQVYSCGYASNAIPFIVNNN